DDVDGSSGHPALRKSSQVVEMALPPTGIGQQDRESEDLPVALKGDVHGRIEVLLGKFPDDVVKGSPEVRYTIANEHSQAWRGRRRKDGLNPPVFPERTTGRDGRLERIRLRCKETRCFRFESVQV